MCTYTISDTAATGTEQVSTPSRKRPRNDSLPAVSAHNFVNLLQPSPNANTPNNASTSPFQMVCFSCSCSTNPTY